MNYCIILKFILIIIFLMLAKTKNPTIYNLKINHLKKPFGIDIKNNIFSFLSDESGPFKAYLFLENEKIEEKQVLLNECHSFTFEKPLQYNKIYKYIVEGKSSKAELEFETAVKLESLFIKPKNKKLKSPIFTKTFTVSKGLKIKRGRLYITGLGLYQAFINNKKVGNAYLTPGYNDYDYYLRYQTFDIGNLLEEHNIIEIHMGNGWYKGRFGAKGKENLLGDEYKLCLHLLIEYDNDIKINILSDETWKVKQSKERKNNIYDGEIIDYTLPDTPLEPVIISKEKYNLIPDFGALIVEKDVLYPELYVSPKGEQILDFKQNMVGFVRFKGYLKKNQILNMIHGEILQQGCFFNANYRTAKAILKFKSDGKKRIYEPKFTYYGFRYVLVKGIEKVDPKDFEGVVIYTNLEKTIECKLDNDKINKLIQNTYWSQKGNFLDVPTDCPQRDERFGWTGDAQVFTNTACYNMDSYIFYKKFMNDLRGDQTLYCKGTIPDYSPGLLKKQIGKGAAVWADAGTIIPWNLYLNYGDLYMLKNFYPMMRDYVETLIDKDIKQGNKNLILEGFTYGDWLALDGKDPKGRFGGTDNGFIMSVYYYHSIDLTSKAAQELGYKKDAKKYNILKNKIYKAILKKFFSKDGRLKLNTQTSYVLCLQYKIYKNKEMIIEDFIQRLKKDLYHIKTGFTGTPLILLSLFDNGLEDYAYRILYNKEFPGWLYCINLGATTIWERWNSLLENGTISGTDMNSFNHYAYGSICETIYSRIVGLRNLLPGWKKVLIKPQLNYRAKKVDFSYESISGKYEIHWKWKGNKFKMNVVIPNGCYAQIVLPSDEKYNVTGGSYHYECELNKKIYNPFSVDTPLIDIIKNEEGSKIIKDLFPQIYAEFEKNDEFKSNSIRTAALLPKFHDLSSPIQKCNEKLSEIIP